MNMPTAEEYFKSQIPKYESVSNFMTDGDIFYHAIEFAKLHVIACKQDICEKAKTVTKEVGGGLNIQWEVVDEASILNAYPLENIK